MLLYEVVHEILFDLKSYNLYLCIRTCCGYSIVKIVSYNIFNSALGKQPLLMPCKPSLLQGWRISVG